MTTTISGEPIFQCLQCRALYSLLDAATYRYFPTGICLSCYHAMAKAPGCFARRYDENECPEACPDRAVCPLFQSKEITTMLDLTRKSREALISALTIQRREAARLKSRRASQASKPFAKGSIIGQIFDLVLKGTTLEEVTELCRVLSVPPKDYIRRIRAGFANGFEWDVVDDLDGLGGRAWKVKIAVAPKRV